MVSMRIFSDNVYINNLKVGDKIETRKIGNNRIYVVNDKAVVDWESRYARESQRFLDSAVAYGRVFKVFKIAGGND